MFLNYSFFRVICYVKGYVNLKNLIAAKFSAISISHIPNPKNFYEFMNLLLSELIFI